VRSGVESQQQQQQQQQPKEDLDFMSSSKLVQLLANFVRAVVWQKAP
jgi:hypothetical protein